MKVTYKSKREEKIFADNRRMQMSFGQVRAKNIMKIMSVLQNVDALSQAGEFGFLHLHPLHGNRAGTFGITIIGH